MGDDTKKGEAPGLTFRYTDRLERRSLLQLTAKTVIAIIAAAYGFDCPVDVRKRFGTVPFMPLIGRAAAVARLAHELTPAIRIIIHFRRRCGHCRQCGDRGGGVEVSINDVQLFEVMRIRPGAEGAGGVRARIREIVHAAILRAAVGGLMIEPESVRNFLAHHMLSLVGVVVGGRAEVGIVHLGRALRNVGAAGDVDRSQAQPAVIPVTAVADLSGARDHRATLARSACDNRRQDGAISGIPVARGLRKMPPPVGGGHVIAKLQGELRRGARPVITTP